MAHNQEPSHLPSTAGFQNLTRHSARDSIPSSPGPKSANSLQFGAGPISEDSNSPSQNNSEENREGDPNRALWVMANSTVVTWIASTLEKDLQPSIACIKNARVLGDDLKQRFSQGKNGDLPRSISRCSKDCGTSLIISLKTPPVPEVKKIRTAVVAHNAIIAIDWVTHEIPVGNSMGDQFLETIDQLQLEDNLRRKTLIPGKDKEETRRIEVGRIGHIRTEQGGSPRNQLGRADRARMIAIGERRGGAYYMKCVASKVDVSLVAAVKTNDVWHKRLGHSSPHVLF
ncbi:hypothetical protein CRG98_022258 [Punica granatum]|uniref:GAG-pre-integrase domain-containing protein n=1 Tax=Punica granatum TaxID=22663 RepID=A0A2I0JN98_PUNGR|nr:hypothetical protein CRG98_022258 [Punica granatum]